MSRRLTDEEARPVMLAAGLEPLKPYQNATTPWPSRCLECNALVQPKYASVQQGRRCGYCAGNMIDENQAVATMKAAGLVPLRPYPGSKEHWISQCVYCGQVVHPTYNNIRNKWGGCAACAVHGLKPQDPGLLYLVGHSSLSAVKIGVAKATDKRQRRLKQHAYHGWNNLAIWNGFIVSVAMLAESRVLSNWRKAGIPVACTSEQMPQGGYTETAPMDMVDIYKVRRWVNYEIRKARLAE